MTYTVFPKFQTQYILDQQAVPEHRDLPNTDIFKSKDVTSDVFYIDDYTV
jgi:hypothetical protein